jgi:hypothetical protein
MAKRKYSEVEMIGALKQMEAGRSAEFRKRFVATTDRSLRAGIFWPGGSSGRSTWCILSQDGRCRMRL